jgi:hypothetical protein
VTPASQNAFFIFTPLHKMSNQSRPAGWRAALVPRAS